MSMHFFILIFTLSPSSLYEIFNVLNIYSLQSAWISSLYRFNLARSQVLGFSFWQNFSNSQNIIFPLNIKKTTTKNDFHMTNNFYTCKKVIFKSKHFCQMMLNKSVLMVFILMLNFQEQWIIPYSVPLTTL